MPSTRFNALEAISNRKPILVKMPDGKISDYYASNVFTVDMMKKYLSEKAFKSVMESIQVSKKIDRSVADQVASAMKSWAMEKGATHYTHWFQPLTGNTAEKHDAFFSLSGDNKGIERFKADALVQQEPDASSFPNGGLRATFEARGYTAWDPSSPAFIMEIGSGKTLCIPTIFVAYTGEALDFKAPLLKSQHKLEEAAVKVCQLFDKKITKVFPTLGWEQEYFLVDEALYNARPDLVMAGRTMIGHRPAKGQQFDDHYFGSIPERMYAYMLDLEQQCHKLSIPVKTRHNEVGPGQFELAPEFEEVNVAVDHNQLLMDLMERIARRHKLRVLLHEKPFAGVNGSGKHNNWSMATNTGKNLLSPGKTPKTNLQFLTFFINTIKAVKENADMLRASIASYSNEFRLGANEAPPAIISVFIGSHLTNVLNDIEAKIEEGKMDVYDEMDLKLDIHNKIPDLLLDNTDRNRTSPFAFTGNKFEFRAVGSTTNCAGPMTVMNSIMADQLAKFYEEVNGLIKSKKAKKDEAILYVLKRYITESRAILFEGDNYSDDWVKEAEKRGLENLKDTPRALNGMIGKNAESVFINNGIFTKEELHARHEILLEKYILDVQIESRILRDLCLNHVIPAAITYQNELIESVRGLKEIGLKKSTYASQVNLLEKIVGHVCDLQDLVKDMTKIRQKSHEIKDIQKMAIAYGDDVKPFFDKIRYHADRLELFVSDKHWSLPKYREMLFMR